MAPSACPVLWLCGPAGVGKTAVGWAYFSQLTLAGATAGFVDIDQLGMCYPEPAADEADELDASDFADFCVDTTALSVPEVAERVRECSGGWPDGARTTGKPGAEAAGSSGAIAPARQPAAAGGPILLISGPTGVGKSSVGWEVYVRLRRAGLTAAYLDLDQIGFCRLAPPGDPGNHRVKARNLAATSPIFRAAGAQCLVAVGPVDDPDATSAYASALPAAAMTLCRLRAGPGELTRRILRRGQGGGSWAEPGDPLIGKSRAELRRIAAEAAAMAERTERAWPGELRIDTEGRTAAAAADLVVAQLRWPGLFA